MNGLRIQLSASVNARSTCNCGPATMPARSARIVLPSRTSSESVPVARLKTALVRGVVTVTEEEVSTGEAARVLLPRREALVDEAARVPLPRWEALFGEATLLSLPPKGNWSQAIS